jgi:hypothetical protein
MLKLSLDLNKKRTNVLINFALAYAIDHNPPMMVLEDLKIIMKESFLLLCDSVNCGENNEKDFEVSCEIGRERDDGLFIIYRSNTPMLVDKMKNNVRWDLISAISSSILVNGSVLHIVQVISERIYAR